METEGRIEESKRREREGEEGIVREKGQIELPTPPPDRASHFASPERIEE